MEVMKLKLTKEDKKTLNEWGYPEKDFSQIERATIKTTYEMDERKISLNEALDILGRETYLSGISRSAFHWTSYRKNEKGQGVHFDSSKLFN
jgi:hypothetical protein